MPPTAGDGRLMLNTPIGISYDATTNEVLVADTGHSEIKAYAGRRWRLRLRRRDSTSGSRRRA